MDKTIKTVRGNPLAAEPLGRLLIKFAIPSVLSMLVDALYNIVDQIFIGRGVGYLGIAATTVTFLSSRFFYPSPPCWGLAAVSIRP